jgi:hypothetical protein
MTTQPKTNEEIKGALDLTGKLDAYLNKKVDVAMNEARASQDQKRLEGSYRCKSCDALVLAADYYCWECGEEVRKSPMHVSPRAIQKAEDIAKLEKIIPEKPETNFKKTRVYSNVINTYAVYDGTSRKQTEIIGNAIVYAEIISKQEAIAKLKE